MSTATVEATPIEGIVDYTGPRGSNAGHFQLPPQFDTAKFAANWVLVGPAVEKAQQLQPILGTNKASSGWAVWKYPKGHKNADRPHKVTTANAGEYILMFRPVGIQRAVNAIYGNVSKRHLIRHQNESIPVAPAAVPDAGVLSNERIDKQYGLRDFGDDYTMNVPQNPETAAPQVETPPAEATTQVTE